MNIHQFHPAFAQFLCGVVIKSANIRADVRNAKHVELEKALDFIF